MSIIRLGCIGEAGRQKCIHHRDRVGGGAYYKHCDERFKYMELMGLCAEKDKQAPSKSNAYEQPQQRNCPPSPSVLDLEETTMVSHLM